MILIGDMIFISLTRAVPVRHTVAEPHAFYLQVYSTVSTYCRKE